MYLKRTTKTGWLEEDAASFDGWKQWAAKYPDEAAIVYPQPAVN